MFSTPENITSRSFLFYKSCSFYPIPSVQFNVRCSLFTVQFRVSVHPSLLLKPLVCVSRQLPEQVPRVSLFASTATTTTTTLVAAVFNISSTHGWFIGPLLFRCILRHFRDILPWLYLPQHLLHLVPITSGLPQRNSLVLSRTTGRRGSTSSVRLQRSINGLPQSKSSLSAWHLPGTLSHIISPYRPGPGMVPWLHSFKPWRLVSLLHNEPNCIVPALKPVSQNKGEELSAFCEAIRAAALLAYPNMQAGDRDLLAKDQFLTGLDSRITRIRVKELDPPTLDAALQAALRQQAIMRSEESTSPVVTLPACAVTASVPSPMEKLTERLDTVLRRLDRLESGRREDSPGSGDMSSSSSGRHPIQCYNCGRPGHISRSRVPPATPSEVVGKQRSAALVSPSAALSFLRTHVSHVYILLSFLCILCVPFLVDHLIRLVNVLFPVFLILSAVHFPDLRASLLQFLYISHTQLASYLSVNRTAKLKVPPENASLTIHYHYHDYHTTT